MVDWRVTERARPLRLVVRRFEVRDSSSWNRYGLYWHEVLECGHQLTTFDVAITAQPAKRRRCMQCAQQKLDALRYYTTLAGRAA